MKKLTLFRTMFVREWIGLKRYPFNLLSGLIALYLIFLVVFVGYKALGAGSPQFGDTLDGIVVGFMMWTFAIAAYSTLSWELMNEARMGTLEQLYMTPFGFDWVCIFRVISSFFLNLIFVLPILALMMVTTGRYLHLDLMSIVPLLILSLAGVYGIGFVMGGLALVFKQVQAFFQIIQFVFIGLIAAPISRLPLLKALPLALGSNLIGGVMVDKRSILLLPPGDLLILLINSAFYFLVGFWTFKLFLGIARKRGLLGHY